MIENQIFLAITIVLITAIACWDLRHRRIGIWPVAALLVTGVAWPATVAITAANPATLLLATIGVVAGVVAMGPVLYGMLITGLGRWPRSPGGLLLLPAIITALGAPVAVWGLMAGFLGGAIGGLYLLFTSEREEDANRCPLVACAAAGVLTALALWPALRPDGLYFAYLSGYPSVLSHPPGVTP